jgi:rhodanese-related sulfurtransferase
MNSVAQLLVVVGLSAAGAGGTYLVKGAPVRTVAVVCDPKTLKPDEVCIDQVTGPVLWIDARPRADWLKNGLTGSILWNLDPGEDANAFEEAAMLGIAENPRVVIYCSSEACGVSRQIAAKVNALGMATEVKVLRGGWDALNGAGRIKDSSAAR